VSSFATPGREGERDEANTVRATIVIGVVALKLLARKGIGSDTASTVLVSSGDKSQRLPGLSRTGELDCTTAAEEAPGTLLRRQ
jgi:hypothetical protein